MSKSNPRRNRWTSHSWSRAGGDHAPPRRGQRNHAALRRGGNQRIPGPAGPRVPETWWAFRKLIPLLAASHRVFAVNLRGFGDSGNEPGEYDSTTSAEDLHLLIGQLGVGPVHLTGQDISGATVFRLAATHPEDVLSLTAIEMGLPGFGLEMLADVTHGGTWYIGVLAAPGIPEMLLTGREREFLGGFAFPAMSATPGAITDADIDEFARTYSRPGGWRGAAASTSRCCRKAPKSGLSRRRTG